MAVQTRAKADEDLEQDLRSRSAVRWGVRPSQLLAPLPRATDVPRTALIARMRASPARMIALAAPPGYGKTTLAAQYVDLDDRRSAWLSITEDGNDAISLARSLAVALSPLVSIDPRMNPQPGSDRVDVEAVRASGDADRVSRR
jgi:hypothetical protein